MHGKKSERLLSKLPPPVPAKKPTPKATQEKRRAARELREANLVTEPEVIPVAPEACRCPKCGEAELDVVGEGTESSLIDYV